MHLSLEAILDLVENRGEDPQRSHWNSHIEECAECRQQLEQWREMHSRLERNHLEDAPAKLLANADSIFGKPMPDPHPSIREIIAAIVFDNFTQAAFAGARAGTRGIAPARQLVLRAEEFDIHVRVSGNKPHRQMAGQILSRDGSLFIESAWLHLLRDGERHATTTIDELGEFQFNDVPDELLSLQIDLPHLTVVGALTIDGPS